MQNVSGARKQKHADQETRQQRQSRAGAVEQRHWRFRTGAVQGSRGMQGLKLGSRDKAGLDQSSKGTGGSQLEWCKEAEACRSRNSAAEIKQGLGWCAFM